MKFLKMMTLLLVCGIGLANAQTLPATPNFLFIFIDDQAWDATSVQMLPGEDISHDEIIDAPPMFNPVFRAALSAQ